jgi:hypothetical protein
MDNEFDPSMHIIPLNEKHEPVFSFDENEDVILFAFTENGRITCFPIESEKFSKWGRTIIGCKFLNTINDRIKERFPKNKDINGNKVNQYLLAAVMYGDEGKAAFIFEVWGFTEVFPELDDLFKNLKSLLGHRVGDDHWNAVNEYFTSLQISQWINELILFLKEQLNWSDYVKTAIVSINE